MTESHIRIFRVRYIKNRRAADAGHAVESRPFTRRAVTTSALPRWATERTAA